MTRIAWSVAVAILLVPAAVSGCSSDPGKSEQRLELCAAVTGDILGELGRADAAHTAAERALDLSAVQFVLDSTDHLTPADLAPAIALLKRAVRTASRTGEKVSVHPEVRRAARQLASWGAIHCPR